MKTKERGKDKMTEIEFAIEFLKKHTNKKIKDIMIIVKLENDNQHDFVIDSDEINTSEKLIRIKDSNNEN